MQNKSFPEIKEWYFQSKKFLGRLMDEGEDVKILYRSLLRFKKSKEFKLGMANENLIAEYRSLDSAIDDIETEYNAQWANYNGRAHLLRS